MDVFVGEYDRSVDGNGRITLPAEYRDTLGSNCYLTVEPEGCVSVMTVERFGEKADEMLRKVSTGEMTDATVRKIARRSSLVAIDKGGRITLDELTRTKVGIQAGGNAILVGNFTSLEIWRPSRFETIAGEDDVVTPDRVWNDE